MPRPRGRHFVALAGSDTAVRKLMMCAATKPFGTTRPVTFAPCAVSWGSGLSARRLVAISADYCYIRAAGGTVAGGNLSKSLGGSWPVVTQWAGAALRALSAEVRGSPRQMASFAFADAGYIGRVRVLL